jgi:hypothetical protein
MNNVLTIDPEQLEHVAGGASPAPAQSAPLQLPAPQQQLALPKPFTPPPGMGGPKYSAAWWDLVRARGLFK